MISLSSSGSFSHLESYLTKLSKLDIGGILDKYGQIGVAALRNATPVDSGLAASSWGYQVTHKNGVWMLMFTNSDIENGFPVAVMIQYGHGTGTGGFVQGIDYINPALRPIFTGIVEEVLKVVTSA